jgi:hypothetical protein
MNVKLRIFNFVSYKKILAKLSIFFPFPEFYDLVSIFKFFDGKLGSNFGSRSNWNSLFNLKIFLAIIQFTSSSQYYFFILSRAATGVAIRYILHSLD